MAEYIEKEKTVKVLRDVGTRSSGFLGVIICSIAKVIEKIPAADVVPVVRGKWREEMVVGGFAESWESTCSICGKGYRDIGKPRYCPNCGADMRGEQK